MFSGQSEYLDANRFQFLIKIAIDDVEIAKGRSTITTASRIAIFDGRPFPFCGVRYPNCRHTGHPAGNGVGRGGSEGGGLIHYTARRNVACQNLDRRRLLDLTTKKSTIIFRT